MRSWSACMVSITTRLSGSLWTIWRVASTPSMSGIDTSMRITSGLAAGASAHGLVAVGRPRRRRRSPRSSRARRSPWRSIWWSSTSIRRIVTAVLHRGSSWGSSTTRTVVPAPGRSAMSRRGSDAGGPLAHAQDPVRVDATAVAGRSPTPSSRHRQLGVACRRTASVMVSVDAFGVALGVDDRLLGDPPQLPLLQERQAARLVPVDA